MNDCFIVHATNDKIWNLNELISYLSANQNRSINLRINPEAICFNQIKLYDLLDCFKFAKINLYTNNQLETHNRYNVNIIVNNVFLKHKPDINKSLHTWSEAKKFLAFYHRPTASRLGLASYLFTNYLKQSLIHFNYTPNDDHIRLFEFDKLAQLDTKSLANAASMLNHMPIHAYNNPDVDEIMTWYDYNRDAGVTMYRDILIDIVVESHVAGNTFYPTEKTVRPMLLKKPMLLMTSKDYIDYLLQMGFQTFYEFWDESYDGYEGRERYVRILKIIDDLAKKPINELAAMYKDMQPILDHNYNLLQTQSYKTTITKVV